MNYAASPTVCRISSSNNTKSKNKAERKRRRKARNARKRQRYRLGEVRIFFHFLYFRIFTPRIALRIKKSKSEVMNGVAKTAGIQIQT